MNRHRLCYKLTFYWGGGGTADVYMLDSAFFAILLFFVLPLRHKPWTGTHNQKRAPTQRCHYSTENLMLLIVDFGIASHISVADFIATIVDTPPPPPPPQPSPLLSASAAAVLPILHHCSAPCSCRCTAAVRQGRGDITFFPSQSQSLIILSNTYCLCTGGHFGCSHQKSSQAARWSNLESDPSLENRCRRTEGHISITQSDGLLWKCTLHTFISSLFYLIRGN